MPALAAPPGRTSSARPWSSTSARPWDAEGFIAALRDFQGIWADRDDIDEQYADLKQRSRDSLAALWGDRLVDDPAHEHEDVHP